MSLLQRFVLIHKYMSYVRHFFIQTRANLASSCKYSDSEIFSIFVSKVTYLNKNKIARLKIVSFNYGKNFPLK